MIKSLQTAFNTAKQVVTWWLYCRLLSQTFFSSPSVEGRWGHTLCPLLYFHHPRAFFPRVVNTNPSPPSPSAKKKKGNSVSLRTALRISARTWKRRGLFCFVHFSQITEKFVCFVYLHFLALFGPNAASRTACSHHRPRPPWLFVFQTAIFCWLWIFFCFPVSAQEGNLFTLYLQNCAWGNQLLSPLHSRGQEASGWEEKLLLT